VVSAGDRESILISDLETDHECHGFEGVVAAVDVIAEEEEVGVGRTACDTEQLEKIVELSMDVATNSHGNSDRLHVRFLLKDLLGLGGL
jgi:hypothetical protein